MIENWNPHLSAIRNAQKEPSIGEAYLNMTKISFQPQEKSLIEANLESKLEMIVLASLLRFITSCRFQEEGVLIDWNSKITHFSRSKFIDRLQGRYPWMKKHKILIQQILQGYSDMINEDVAKVKQVSFIVLRLRDLIEWRIWQPDYLEFTSEYLARQWKTPKQGNGPVQPRRKRKDPATFRLRRKLAQRKSRLIATRKTIRKDFRRRGIRVLTAAKYDHWLKQVRDKDKQFERAQILNWSAPKGHSNEYVKLRTKVIKENGFDRAIDYLVVSELLAMYVRAKPIECEDEKPFYQYNENNLHAKLVADQKFKPQMKQLLELVPISPSTLRK